LFLGVSHSVGGSLKQDARAFQIETVLEALARALDWRGVGARLRAPGAERISAWIDARLKRLSVMTAGALTGASLRLSAQTFARRCYCRSISMNVKTEFPRTSRPNATAEFVKQCPASGTAGGAQAIPGSPDLAELEAHFDDHFVQIQSTCRPRARPERVISEQPTTLQGLASDCRHRVGLGIPGYPETSK
jgi:hypothetical protein